MTLLPVAWARRLALAAAAGPHRAPGRGPRAVETLVERLGYVQIDTISVVERAHHHVLASRLAGYQTAWLDGARVFEYWAHAAAFLPWSEFRYTLPRKERHRSNGALWYGADTAAVEHVRRRITAEGPLRSRDFEAPRQKAGWWDWKPAKRALEYLFMSGELMVTREGFQKRFDLTERVLPTGVDTRHPSPREQAQWLVERALRLWGLVARDEIGYLRREHTDQISGVLADEVEAGRLVKVGLEGVGSPPYWVRPETLAGHPPPPPRGLHILSPFDPFVIHRARLNRLFGFDFTLECYVPASRRLFGYFALPLLQGDRFVGLLDAKADRAEGRLKVLNLRYLGTARARPAFDRALTKALAAFSRFNGVEPP